MSLWSWDTIRERAGGRWLHAPSGSDRVPRGAAIDTRDLEPGMIFAAFKGERADGHAFIPQAAERGAAMAIATDPDAVPADAGVPVLLVDDATEALTELARFWRDAVPGLKVIGVTGSNGKTTTCRLLHGAVSGAGSKGGLACSSPAKSFNNALGVPVTLLNARPDDAVLVCEIGMSTPGEIARRCELARPDAAVITTVGEAHYEGLGSLEAIAREKASIARGVGERGLVVTPTGLGLLDRALAETGTRARIVRVGPHDDADLRLGDVRPGGGGTAFTLGSSAFSVPLAGAHNASNAALAVVIARWLGVPDAAIRAGLAGVGPVPMRLERLTVATEPETVVLNDAYNANPGSVRAALNVLAATPAAGRRVAVLGDMLELGAIGPRSHREMLSLARELGIGTVATVGPLYAAAAADIGWSVHAEADADDEAIGRAAALVRPGDTVLVKGSRGVRLERVVALLTRRVGREAGSTA